MEFSNNWSCSWPYVMDERLSPMHGCMVGHTKVVVIRWSESGDVLVASAWRTLVKHPRPPCEILSYGLFESCPFAFFNGF